VSEVKYSFEKIASGRGVAYTEYGRDMVERGIEIKGQGSRIKIHDIWV
jgi:hypothetical protein